MANELRGMHALVPGRPAIWWNSLLLRVSVAGYALFVSANILGVVSDRVNYTAVGLPSFGILMLVALARLVARFRGLPNERREVEAGYTTLAGVHPDLDQVEPEYGRIVRSAGEPYLPVSGSRVRVASIVLVLIVAAALGFAIAGFTSRNEGARLLSTLVLSAVVVIAPILIGGIWFARRIVRRNIAAALTAYPEAVCFTSQRSQDLLRGLRAANSTFRARELAVGFPLHFVVAADADGVHLVATTWRPFETIPWDRIEGMTIGSVSESPDVQVAAIELHIRSESSGEIRPVRLTVGESLGGEGLDDVVAVLEEVRRGPSAAR